MDAIIAKGWWRLLLDLYPSADRRELLRLVYLMGVNAREAEAER